MNKLKSRLANQSDSDSLIANEAYDMNFTVTPPLTDRQLTDRQLTDKNSPTKKIH